MSSSTRPRHLVLVPVVAGAMLLAGCADGDAASGPGEAFDNRIAAGTAVDVTVQADPSALEGDEAEELQEVLDMQGEGPLMTAAVSPDGDAFGVSFGGDAVQARFADEALYVKVDWDRLAELDPDITAELPTAEEQADMTAELPPQVGELATGLFDGDWVGITGLSEDTLGTLGALGGATGQVPDQDELDEMRALLEDHELDSVGAAMDAYVTATGDNPWELALHVRDLAEAMADLSREAEELGLEGPGMTGTDGAGDIEDELDELPETVEGFTLEAEDGRASRMVVDVATVMESADAEVDADELARVEAADLQLVLDMRDVGDLASAPSDATVADIDTLIGQFMEGF